MSKRQYARRCGPSGLDGDVAPGTNATQVKLDAIKHAALAAVADGRTRADLSLNPES